MLGLRSLLEGSEGVASATFGYSTSATGAETFTGTGAASFGFSVAVTARETFSGTVAETFGFALAEAGAETFTGIVASTFGFATAATGAETFAGAGSPAFGFSSAANGTVESVGVPQAATSRGHRFERVQPRLVPAPRPPAISARVAASFGFGLAATGEVTEGDAEWLLLLAA